MKMDLKTLLRLALDEDLPNGDITSTLCIPTQQRCEAKIIAKAHGHYFGNQIIREIVQIINPSIQIHFEYNDGDPVTPSDCIAKLKGNTQDILKAERVLLNFLQHLSGVCSITHQYVTALDNPKIAILDTRKTTPLLRALEKEAVLAGGGKNHRHGLSDMVLMKENHLAALKESGNLQNLGQICRDFKTENPKIKIEIEISSIAELETLDLSEVDIIMLDNFSIPDIEAAIKICKSCRLQAQIEVSGNITLEGITAYRHLAIDRISIGRLTHSVKALDLSMLICYT